MRKSRDEIKTLNLIQCFKRHTELARGASFHDDGARPSGRINKFAGLFPTADEASEGDFDLVPFERVCLVHYVRGERGD